MQQLIRAHVAAPALERSLTASLVDAIVQPIVEATSLEHRQVDLEHSVLFGSLAGFVAELYAYRWPILIVVFVVVVAVIAVGRLRGWHQVIWHHRLAVAIRRHKLVTTMFVAPVLGLFIFAGYFTLSPIFERTHLEEPSPLDVLIDLTGDEEAAVQDTGDEEATGDAAGDAISARMPRISLSGEFRGVDDFHFGRGRALLIETTPDRHTLRFEDFSVRNGPRLHVYLSPDPGGYADGVLNLGKLKATDGAFNYTIPSGTDILQFKSVVIWCRLLGIQFAVAPLSEVQRVR